MNRRRLLGLLCPTALLATSCDNKGDYWGAMGIFKTTLTLERICDMAMLSQDSVNLLSDTMGANTEELYWADAVMVGKVTGGEVGHYHYPRFLIARDKEMKEVIVEAYTRHNTGNTFYAFLDLDTLTLGETHYCAMNDCQYGYSGRPGLLDHVLGENSNKERFSEVKAFRFSGLSKLIVHDTQLTGYSCYLSAEVCSRTDIGIIEQGTCHSSIKELPEITDQKILAWGTRMYNYSNFGVKVMDLLPATHYYIRPYVTTEEGTGYGPAVEFTTERGAESVINSSSSYQYNGTVVELYISFYTSDLLTTSYGYSYGVYSQETGAVTDEQVIEVPFIDDYRQTFDEIATGLRPETLCAFRVYAKNGVGISYSNHWIVEIPAERNIGLKNENEWKE